MNYKLKHTDHSSIKLLLILLIAVVPTKMFGTISFRTAELERLCSVLAINKQGLHVGNNQLTSKGLSITVHVNTDSVVDHVGRSLFNNNMKSSADILALNFLERYFLQLSFPKQETTAAYMLRDNNVTFKKGNIATIAKIQPTDAFSLQNADRKYSASWSRDGTVLLSITFPAEYQLLSGEDKAEADQLLEADIKTLAKGAVLPSEKKPTEDYLQPTDMSQYFILKGNQYYNKNINTNLYYIKDTENQFNLVADVAHPAETSANMMLSIFTPGQYNLDVQQNIYGLKSKHYSVDLQQWINYCKQTGCELYFGLEELLSDSVKATVIAVNNTANYNHVLNVLIPITAIDNREGTIQAQLTSFVPTHNIRSLLAKVKTRKR